MPPLLVAGHLRQLPHTPAPAADVIDVDAEKKAVPVILPALVNQLAHGRRVRVAGGDGQSRGWFPGDAGFRREGTCESWFMCSIGV